MAIFYNGEFLGHVQSPFHPESPERLMGIVQKLQQHGLWEDVFTSKVGKKEHLMLIHEEDYIDFIKTCGECAITGDTIVHKETYDIAALSAECAIDAAAHSKREHKPAFALTRPPGHHAGRDFGLGFCYFNNISIAAKHLLDKGDKKIAIVDVDVHHGNGTEGIFASDPAVLYISTHQQGLFPGSGHAEYVGEGPGTGFTVNIPLPRDSGDSTYDVAMSDVVAPILRDFKPDAILVSWGADTHYRDPIANMTLSSSGILRQGTELIELARMCKNRITFMLEGGYDVQALSETTAALIGSAAGVNVPLELTDVVDNSCLGRGAIDRCRKIASEYWDL